MSEKYSLDIIKLLSKPDDFEGGPVDLTTTAEKVTFTGKPVSILLQADDDNTGDIFIGKSNVESDGTNAMLKMSAGAAFSFDYTDQLYDQITGNEFWAVASSGIQTLYKMGLVVTSRYWED